MATTDKRNLTNELSALTGNGIKDLLTGKTGIQKLRQDVNVWWTNLNEVEKAEYKEELREHLMSIKRAAEAITQELFAASTRR